MECDNCNDAYPVSVLQRIKDLTARGGTSRVALDEASAEFEMFLGVAAAYAKVHGKCRAVKKGV